MIHFMMTGGGLMLALAIACLQELVKIFFGGRYS